MTDAAFIEFLTAHGLALAASSDTILECKRRYGLRRWYGFSDVVYLPPAPLFPELRQPFFFLDHRTCLLPPNELECDFAAYPDGEQNQACAVRRFSELFGSPQPGAAVNTLSATWTFERMSLSLRTFLRDKTPARSLLYERHPELWNVCRITIDRNLAAPLARDESSLLDGLGENDFLLILNAPRRVSSPIPPYERGLFRLGTVSRPQGFWRHARHIGWTAGPWAAFFDRTPELRLRLDQAEPARGSGSARLSLRLANPFSLDHELVDTTLLDDPRSYALDGTAHAVAAFWNLPLDVNNYPDY